MIGKKVYHPKYGKGEIVDTRYKGLEYLVLFQIGIKKWVRFDEVQFESENRLNEVNIMKNNENLKERSIIEALRLGIVPYRYIEEFTFGRDEEIEKLKEWLSEGKKNSLFLIIGEYGSGKTHLISYLEAMALKEGFATSLVELDLNEAPFFRPKRVYREIIKSFKYPKSNGNLGEFRSFIKDALKLGYLNDHPYFKYLEKDNESIWEWIEAKDQYAKPYEPVLSSWGYFVNAYSYLPPLLDQSTSMNVYCNLISTISWVAREAFNLKGFLLIFDEAESINDASSSQKEKSDKFIKALWSLGKNDERLLSTKSAKNLGFDISKNPRASRIPYIYKLPFNLKFILAFTFPILDEELDINIPYVRLEKLPTEVLEEIFWYIWEIYQKAYDIRRDISPWYILDKLLEKESITRLFIKGTVEAFDLLTFENKKFMRKYGFL